MAAIATTAPIAPTSTTPHRVARRRTPTIRSRRTSRCWRAARLAFLRSRFAVPTSGEGYRPALADSGRFVARVLVESARLRCRMRIVVVADAHLTIDEVDP